MPACAISRILDDGRRAIAGRSPEVGSAGAERWLEHGAGFLHGGSLSIRGDRAKPHVVAGRARRRARRSAGDGVDVPLLGVVQNAPVPGHQRHAELACGRDEKAIGRVPVEIAGQTGAPRWRLGGDSGPAACRAARAGHRTRPAVSAESTSRLPSPLASSPISHADTGETRRPARPRRARMARRLACDIGCCSNQPDRRAGVEQDHDGSEERSFARLRFGNVLQDRLGQVDARRDDHRALQAPYRSGTSLAPASAARSAYRGGSPRPCRSDAPPAP